MRPTRDSDGLWARRVSLSPRQCQRQLNEKQEEPGDPQSTQGGPERCSLQPLRVGGKWTPRGRQEEGALTAGDAGFTVTREGVSTAAQPAGIVRPNVH